MTTQAKTCSHCREVKPLDQFHRNRTTPDGHTYHCKSCESAKARRRYVEGKDKILERNRQWRETNRERDLENKRQRYLKNRDRAAELGRSNRLKRYGLTETDYIALLDAQGGRCAICSGASSARLAVDHDHDTGVVRGLLCGNCNRGIGYLRDSVEILRAAVAYLTQERPA